MRRVGNLFEAFCSFENLLSAYRKTRLGSRQTAESAAFFTNLERELLGLQTELRAGIWAPGLSRFFEIYDPKHRTIAVAPYRDRVMHHALVNVLEPIFERQFVFDSYATRKGKGVHAAVRRAQFFLRHNEWFLKSDVEKYFDSIHHDTLLCLLERKIKDKRLLDIAEKIIRGGGSAGCGLPIGNRTSQFFANVYLDPLDHFVADRLGAPSYVRYMDDFVVFQPDKSALKAQKFEIEGFIHEKLRLQLKPSATFLNNRQNGLSFLGTRIFSDIIRLRPENLRRIAGRIRLREALFREGLMEEKPFLASMSSYWALLSYYPLHGLRRALLTDSII